MTKNYSKEEVIEIFKEYLDTQCTIESIYKKYGWTLKRLFKEYGLSKRKERTGHYPLTWLGEKITNEIEAYFVGFMYADGTLNDTQVAIKLKNQESEFKLLSSFRNYITPEQQLTYEKDKTAVKLVINSKIFSSNLQNLGILQKKTYKTLVIPEMDEFLLRHFIRGYFDGDGTIYYDRKYIKANICSINYDFLVLLQQILNRNNISCKINTEIREGKNLLSPQGDYKTTYKNMYRLVFSSKTIKNELKNYFYDNSTIFLQRKRDLFFKENTEVN